jgi:hypothetical protein
VTRGQHANHAFYIPAAGWHLELDADRTAVP